MGSENGDQDQGDEEELLGIASEISSPTSISEPQRIYHKCLKIFEEEIMMKRSDEVMIKGRESATFKSPFCTDNNSRLDFETIFLQLTRGTKNWAYLTIGILEPPAVGSYEVSQIWDD